MLSTSYPQLGFYKIMHLCWCETTVFLVVWYIFQQYYFVWACYL